MAHLRISCDIFICVLCTYGEEKGTEEEENEDEVV